MILHRSSSKFSQNRTPHLTQTPPGNRKRTLPSFMKIVLIVMSKSDKTGEEVGEYRPVSLKNIHSTTFNNQCKILVKQARGVKKNNDISLPS